MGREPAVKNLTTDLIIWHLCVVQSEFLKTRSRTFAMISNDVEYLIIRHLLISIDNGVKEFFRMYSTSHVTLGSRAPNGNR